MIIKTKFDKDDRVIFINNNSIISAIIKDVIYLNDKVKYLILLNKSKNSIDKDETILKTEAECFLNIDELAKYYKKNMTILDYKKENDSFL